MAIPIPAIDGAQASSAIGGATSAKEPTGGGFGKALAGAIDSLSQSQNQAADQAQQLATGQATDISGVVMSVEKASLELQLAVQLRNKGVEAYQEIFRMQV